MMGWTLLSSPEKCFAVKSLHPLTGHCELDILQPALSGGGPNAMRSIATATFHHASRSASESPVAACAAAGDVGGAVWQDYARLTEAGKRGELQGGNSIPLGEVASELSHRQPTVVPDA